MVCLCAAFAPYCNLKVRWFAGTFQRFMRQEYFCPLMLACYVEVWPSVYLGKQLGGRPWTSVTEEACYSVGSSIKLTC